MDDVKDFPDNLRQKESKVLSYMPNASELPCTPLERGVKNYYPEGVKARKSYSPYSQISAIENSFDRTQHVLAQTPELLSLSDQGSVKDFNPHDSYVQMNDNSYDTFSSSESRENDENLPASPHPLTSFSDSFSHSNNEKSSESFNDEKLKRNCEPVYKDFLNYKEYSLSTNDIHQTARTQLRCESVEPFFPDIFSQPSFFDRPSSVKSVSSDIIYQDDVISSLPSRSSADTTHSRDEGIEDHALSSEGSALDEANISADDESSSNGFKVYIRIKPLDEQDGGGASSNRLRCVQVKGRQNLVLCTRPSLKKENTGSNHWFKFDRVLDESSSQRDTYDVTTQPLVEMTLQGHHTCLITYGSPGSGKSHALFGKASSGKYKGIIIRAAEALMALADRSSTSETMTRVSMSFIQIYNEKLYDILDPSATDNIKFHDVGDVHSLEGVTELPVENTDDVTKQLRRNPNRLRDAGRSHTIFTLFYRKNEELKEKEDEDPKNIRKISGRLDFVDLVGVNRPTKHSTHDSTGNNATAKANRSLQVFANVIWSLTDDKTNQPPPYRDSRLTRLLREALGGNCVTRLLVTASSCPNSAHETLNCLAFARRAMSVKNFPTPHVNVETINAQESEEIPTNGNLSTRANQSKNVKKLVENSDNCASLLAAEEMRITPLSQTTNDDSSSSLPPIKPVTEAETNHNATVVCEPSSPNRSEVVLETENLQKLAKRRKSKDHVVVDIEVLERKKGEKSRKTKRKGKARDISNTTQPWTSEQSSSNFRNVVSLPLIGTPDLRRKGYSGSEANVQDTKNRRKSVSNKNISHDTVGRELDSLKRLKERPSSSLSQHAYKDGRPLSRTMENANERKEAFAGAPSPPHEQIFSLTSNATHCCMKCQEREEKIKRDYDHMILFSKKDRDDKQTRIEELEVLLKKARNESAPVAEVQRLTEEKVKDHQALKKQKELTESYKSQLANMVSAAEWTTLQELRRKDTIELEELRNQVQTLKKDLEEQTIGASKLLQKKSEQIAEFETEIAILRQKVSKVEVVKKSEFDELKLLYEQVQQERDDVTLKLQSEAREVAFKYSCAVAQVAQVQEAKAELEKQFEQDKELLQRDMSKLNKQIAELTKSKKKQELLLNMPIKCDSTTNTEDLRSKLNGLAYSVHCLRCAAQRSIEENNSDETPTVQDAELQILLLQDTKNRELLLQLKRERNLLRDVMKIMYCRQWFTEEGNPHVKRTLRKVGIDTRELVVIKKD